MVIDLTERAQDELRGFEFFCSKLVTQQKKQLAIEDFQRELLTPTFAGVQSNVICLPKKQGKSTLMAALALYHLLTFPMANVVILATSTEQARNVFDHCRKFVTASPEIRELFSIKDGFKEIRLRENPLAKIKVYAADKDTLEGIEPTLGIIDEYHAHRTAHAYGIVRDGIGTRDGQMLVITNTGEDELSPFGELRTNALELPVSEVRGAYKFFTNDKRTFAYHEYSLDPDADVTDMSVVQKANPASWSSLEWLEERFNEPGITLQRWKRFACGIWVRSENTIILPHEWDGLSNSALVIPPGSDIWVGWDHATRGPDKAALVPLWWKSMDERVFGTPIILTAPKEGMISDLDITNALLDLEKYYRIKAVVYDPEAGAAMLATQFDRERGWTMVEHSSKPGPAAKADVRFLEAIRERKIVHNGDPEFRQHVLNAVERTVSGDQWIFGRPKHGARVPIDALKAASIVHHAAYEDESYDRRGVKPVFIM
jgi:phage terminase large subunit-like protein